MKPPTGEQCTDNKHITLGDGRAGRALWYPQMGGYVGKAVVLDATDPDNDCFEVLVWHDGDFPFDEDDRPPRELHHCMAEHFIEFGNKLLAFRELGLDNPSTDSLE